MSNKHHLSLGKLRQLANFILSGQKIGRADIGASKSCTDFFFPDGPGEKEPPMEAVMARDDEHRSYLGDGVYARWDGYHIVLETDSNTIYLDPYVLTSFKAYQENLSAKLNRPKEGP